MGLRLIRRWSQLRARRAGRRADAGEMSGRRAQWLLLIGRCQPSALAAPRPQALTPIQPPAEVFWADPFLWSQGDRLFLFFEELPFATRRGHISVIELDGELRPRGPARPVLEGSEHLSYPFLLEHRGELYMLPEMQQSGRLDLFRCVDFPLRWERVRTLIQGLRIADATLHQHEGRWWMFCSAKRRGQRINETLLAFHADSPMSDHWTPHPHNPLVRDFSRARPAGRLLRDEQGRLLRPAQDCVRRYGHGLCLNEILTLSPERYAERPIWRMNGEQAGGWRAMHHIDWHRGVLVMDAQRLLPGGPRR
jgi:hypothetical protein